MTQLAVAVSGGVDSLCALLRLHQGRDARRHHRHAHGVPGQVTGVVGLCRVKP